LIARRAADRQFDLFVPYISDLPLRDQRETMERPFFSLAKRKRLKPIEYVTLGSGVGLSSVSPWSSANPSATTFTLLAAVWLIIVQWLSSATGGYLAGRLRTKWTGLHTDEVFFRDTAPNGNLDPSDRTYLAKLVAARTGMSQQDLAALAGPIMWTTKPNRAKDTLFDVTQALRLHPRASRSACCRSSSTGSAA
jgi:hypothetical protein